MRGQITGNLEPDGICTERRESFSLHRHACCKQVCRAAYRFSYQVKTPGSCPGERVDVVAGRLQTQKKHTAKKAAPPGAEKRCLL